MFLHSLHFFFFFNDTATTEIYTLSLHDALPISGLEPERVGPRFGLGQGVGAEQVARQAREIAPLRSEEHTSELQSPCNLVCRLLLEKKKNNHQARVTMKHITDVLSPVKACYRHP